MVVGVPESRDKTTDESAPRGCPVRSAGLHLSQELSTSAQQITHSLLFDEGLDRREPGFQRARRGHARPSGGPNPALAVAQELVSYIRGR